MTETLSYLLYTDVPGTDQPARRFTDRLEAYEHARHLNRLHGANFARIVETYVADLGTVETDGAS